MLQLLHEKFTDPGFLCLFTGVIELTLITQTQGVYPILEYGLREDGYFADQTEAQRQNTFARIYSLVLLWNQTNKFLLGFIIDLYGMWQELVE